MNRTQVRPTWLIFICLMTVLSLVLVWLRAGSEELDDPGTVETSPAQAPESRKPGSSVAETLRAKRTGPEADKPAEEIVAAKLKRFAQSRREIMRAMARQKNVAVPPMVEQFFDAVETGDWAQIKAAFDAINGGDKSAGHTSKRSPEVTALWASIIDTYGVAEQVHIWPAQKLLDMGNSIMNELRPGMVYLGGTDDGRWIPTLLDATSDGEKHVVITQNGLADSTYLDYIRFLYGDRFVAPSQQDSERAFSDYMSDARKRLAHDTEFPNEPKQIRPGEDIREIDGKISVSGIVAVMDINERIVRQIMEANPNPLRSRNRLH